MVATPLFRANEKINQEGLAFESASPPIRVLLECNYRNRNGL
jgi:hypothetical protein